jgi:GNAT superfamily N-acetyltransferase
MYSTCIFCNRPLGTNEVLEIFPVGRRLSFDAAKGRLWVICRRCERWNLSPLETRWDVIEACERLFRETRLRVSTDNIGLARLSEGLELVRLGKPLRGEFAAWRYGDQFGRRRRRSIAYGVAGGVGVTLIIAGGAAAGASIGGGWYGYTQLIRWISGERMAARLRDPDGEKIKVQLKHLQKSRLVPADGGNGWELHIRYAKGWGSGFSSGWGEPLVFTGDEAMEVAGKLMARANRSGGSKQVVQQAVSRIEDVGHPERFLVEATRESERLRREKAGDDPRKLEKATAGSLAKLPRDIRLAVEMATQEESERRAMEGELEVLEEAWRQAEVIAGIADSLLVPQEMEEFVQEEKRKLAGEPKAAASGGRGSEPAADGDPAQAEARADSSPDMVIRHIRPEDDVALSRIIREVMSEFEAVGEGFSVDDPEVSAMYDAYAGPRHAYFVAERNGAVAGGSGIGPLVAAGPEVCELRKMYLLADARGQGVGRRLLEACLEAARERDYRSCYLETMANMDMAKKLYESVGLRPLEAPMGDTGHFGCDRWYSLAL